MTFVKVVIFNSKHIRYLLRAVRLNMKCRPLLIYGHAKEQLQIHLALHKNGFNHQAILFTMNGFPAEKKSFCLEGGSSRSLLFWPQDRVDVCFISLIRLRLTRRSQVSVSSETGQVDVGGFPAGCWVSGSCITVSLSGCLRRHHSNVSSIPMSRKVETTVVKVCLPLLFLYM